MNKAGLLQELNLKAVRSSGAGGQHVNKVSTKVELAFDVANSNALSSIEKERVLHKLAKRLTKDNILMLQADATRSQFKNKELVIKRFLELLENAIKIQKKRRKTKPSRSSVEKRLRKKKKDALKKANRGRPKLD
ncbi:aminoacyl-tRNA hydrolase [Maribacter polysiphoniae]|uniref:Aminoacyl-tRNA hydrolase n=1 Tax=Maribacter polysiphoniae TaxID=429344 RepID=A0A316ER80_9FLAO|nr:alternative ribosome rescue aminoacyl-tRNA hydrolase ArfB [Maribacter polysiphoniae]MBD1260120.1 aminoacyl-tRNA hydrolase [Maribacter polysiphoniae]PWK25580.1 ribosome-associated protein [Maribacter polysiphoniae]